jgi:hypothetical protein
VGIALDADQGGLWVATSNGWVCGFGDAQSYNYVYGVYATGACLPAVGGVSNIVGIVAAPSGPGFLLVGSDGGVFSRNGAPDPTPNSLPARGISVHNIVGITMDPGGNGYWLVGSDGGVFTFGSVNFFGSYGGAFTTNGVVGIVDTPDSQGYWLIRSTGAVLGFGDAAFLGSMEYQSLAPGGAIVGAS